MTVPTSSTTPDAMARRAHAAFIAMGTQAPSVRAGALRAVASALTAHDGELIPLARAETGLSGARLTGELRRTAVQVRLFADVVMEGRYLDVRIDDADPQFVLGPRPDLRRFHVGVGPVLNFAASNFPFAFSVAGGDTAAALAAGCPVIVKASAGHPRLSARTAEIAASALVEAGLPDGVLQLVASRSDGLALLDHPLIKAASFTGSQRVGRALADRAHARPDPIPFYGELGSVNPVVVTAGALRERGEGLLEAYVASVSGSAGQLCTKPGFCFLPAEALAGALPAVAGAAATVSAHRMLTPGIADSYEARCAQVLGIDGVRVIHRGSERRDEDGQAHVTPTIVATGLGTLREAGPTLLEEVFGPFSVIVGYPSGTDLVSVIADLFPGNLTVTVHVGSGERDDAAGAMLAGLARHAGRVIVDGWPTGVAVTPAMQHGGPWPATTADATSVGTAAIGRFLRAVAFQNVPAALMPPALSDANPWSVPRTVAPAGASAGW
ncbi:MAG: aldehyde dehydrogenase (NADP(+)) [Bifidobacteriaceae bacterium]|jgi:NADP-dependent aldehyde dehydrogenase|nr:aldehyde dehydrogenase (NADP(+)) [Bifidobacteriaceae bacterium]